MDENGTSSVVVVEDDPTLRFAVSTWLEYEPNIDVQASVGTGRAGLRHVEDGHPDVLLTDVSLPDVGVRHLIAGSLAASPGTRIVIFTGHDRSDVEHLLQGFDVTFVQKGRALHELFDALRRACLQGA